MKDILKFFGTSLAITLAALALVAIFLSWDAVFLTAVLIVIELAFSFDNAVINAKILAVLPRFWQIMFLTVGVLIAVITMRIIFPIVIVGITAHVALPDVAKMALYHPQEYAEKLHMAHTAIAAFGGAFLLTLAMKFFFDQRREIRWLKRLETQLQRVNRVWFPAVGVLGLVVVLALLPANSHGWQTLEAGIFGIALYYAIDLIGEYFAKAGDKKTHGVNTVHGVAAFSMFMYLQILDASFSFDEVIGAFAITGSVILIAIGLGVGAYWVRSLTVFMVRRNTLGKYQFLETGAHYTIFMLALSLLFSIFLPLPEALPGALGVLLIGSAVFSSRKSNRKIDNHGNVGIK
jgi:hypothetical protein